MQIILKIHMLKKIHIQIKKLNNMKKNHLKPIFLTKHLNQKMNHLLLNNNQIDNLQNGCFTGLLKLKQLELQKNDISAIEEGAFDFLFNLDNLDLSSNQIKTWKNNTFNKIVDGKVRPLLINLQKLSMDKNKINRIEKNAIFGLLKLKKLSLRYNFIHTLADTAFQSSLTLEDLDVSNNRIGIINPKTFAHLGKFKSINLSNNLILCGCETKDGLSNLSKETKLIGNCVTPAIFSDKSIKNFKEHIDPCLENGKCSNDLARCNCNIQYEGEACEKLKPKCQIFKCQNGGVCSQTGGKHVCICTGKYKGEWCEKKIPKPNNNSNILKTNFQLVVFTLLLTTKIFM